MVAMKMQIKKFQIFQFKLNFPIETYLIHLVIYVFFYLTCFYQLLEIKISLFQARPVKNGSTKKQTKPNTIQQYTQAWK